VHKLRARFDLNAFYRALFEAIADGLRKSSPAISVGLSVPTGTETIKW